jgi:hypothetical protein
MANIIHEIFVLSSNINQTMIHKKLAFAIVWPIWTSRRITI